MTQPELASAIGVSNGSVGNWESGANLPEEKHLRKIVEILNSTPEELFATSPESLKEDAISYSVAPPKLFAGMEDALLLDNASVLVQEIKSAVGLARLQKLTSLLCIVNELTTRAAEKSARITT